MNDHPPEADRDPAISDTASLRIRATPERLYDLVTDVANMGQLSPECTGGRWLGDATGARVGARFKGSNRRGWVRWSTHNTVVAADPGREFAFETSESGMRWTYRFVPEADSTVVSESREAFRDRPLISRVFSGLLLGGMEAHDDELRQGLLDTLERLKQVAEA